MINIVNDSLKEFSKFVPYKTTIQITTTPNSDKSSLANFDEVLWPEKIEYRDDTQQTKIDYEGFWEWNEFDKVIEWDFWWDRQISLNVQVAKIYPSVANDSDDVQINAKHEHLFLNLCVANVIYSMTTQEWMDSKGSLKPVEERFGDVVYRYGDFRRAAVEFKNKIIEQIVDQLNVSINNKYSGRRSVNLDKKEDPDGWVPPPIFWEVK